MARAIILGAAEDIRQRQALRLERRRLRDSSNPLDLPESLFIQHFRVTKTIFRQILLELTPFLPLGTLNTSVRNELKILAALSFFATGSYQKPVAESSLLGMSQSTMSRVLNQVVDALNTPGILVKFVKFPSTQSQRELVMRGFMAKFSFPGVVGCIDGTHVAIIRPNCHEEAFFNRKNFHSLNVMIICDVNMEILHADASFGGASHDSHVWNQSQVKSVMERLAESGEHCWFLGDSGYAQRPWLMTPILGAEPHTPEEVYTKLHCTVRNTVERCIGVLKNRWRCLLAHRTLHYTPKVAAKTINACVVLHNICNAHGLPPPELNLSELVEDSPTLPAYISQNSRVENDGSRDMLVRRLWLSGRN